MNASITINGQAQSTVEFNDRGLMYGDGLFETLLYNDGRIEFWHEHWQRLENGCHQLAIPVPSRIAITDDIAHMMASTTGCSVIKIIVTRGVGARGYRTDKSARPTVIISSHPAPEYPARYFGQGIKACFCQHRLSENPALAGLKHLNRLDQVMARQEWGDEFQEGIMLDQQGRVVEGVMSNIFLLENNKLLTPVLDRAGVAGIIREEVLRQAAVQGLKTEITTIEKKQIMDAEAVFFTNSVIRLWPLRSLESRQWSPHSVVQALQKELLAL